jgi:NADH dehydrogenase
VAISAEDLRSLIDSSVPDPTLVLAEGRVRIVQVDDLDTDAHRGSLVLISRDELLNRLGGRCDASDAELETIAATVSTGVETLGG